MRYIRFPARFLRRLTALVLALSVCLCAAPAASASDWSGVLNEDRLLPAMPTTGPSRLASCNGTASGRSGWSAG